MRRGNQGMDQASFLPAEYVRSKAQHRANVVMLLLFGAVSIGTIGAFMLNYKRKVDLAYEVRQVREQFEAESSKLEQLRELEAQRVEILERAEVVTAIIERVPRSVMLAEVVRSMPASVALTELELSGERVKVVRPKEATDREKPRSVRGPRAERRDPEAEQAERVLPPRFEHAITLTGLAEINNDVADYLAGLKDSPLFASVELQYINETVIEESELRKFRITMKFREAADVSRVASIEETGLIDEAATFGVTQTPAVTE